LTEAETDLKRYQELVQSGVASRQQLEQAQLKFDTTKAGLSQATEQLKEAKVNLGYTEIRSPIDGIVVDKHAESGDLASPGRSLLTLQKPTCGSRRRFPRRAPGAFTSTTRLT
jgi:multidrug resistance efflux pump